MTIKLLLPKGSMVSPIIADVNYIDSMWRIHDRPLIRDVILNEDQYYDTPPFKIRDVLLTIMDRRDTEAAWFKTHTPTIWSQEPTRPVVAIGFFYNINNLK